MVTQVTQKQASEKVVKVDPRSRRPANADESVPEALVPDVVRANLQRDESRSSIDANQDSTTDRPADQLIVSANQQAVVRRWQRIQRRAYEIAQERGFTPGAELNDWLRAESEIDASPKQAAPQDQFTG